MTKYYNNDLESILFHYKFLDKKYSIDSIQGYNAYGNLTDLLFAIGKLTECSGIIYPIIEKLDTIMNLEE